MSELNNDKVVLGEDDVQFRPLGKSGSTDNDLLELKASDASQEARQPSAASVPEGSPSAAAPSPSGTYDVDYLRGLDANISDLKARQAALPEETAAQRAKRERREKNRRIMAAVGEGLSALGNMYFATKGAVPMKVPEYSRSVLKQEAKLKAQRDADAAARLNYALRISALEKEKSGALHRWRKEAEDSRLKNDDNDRKNKAEQREEDLHPYKVAKGVSDMEDAKNRETISGIQARNEQRNQDDKHRVSVSRISANNSTAERNRAQANKAGKDPVGNFLGESYNSVKNMDKSTYKWAPVYGVPTEVTTVSPRGVKTTRQRPLSAVRAEIERKAKEAAHDNTPPSRRK